MNFYITIEKSDYDIKKFDYDAERLWFLAQLNWTCGQANYVAVLQGHTGVAHHAIIF